MGPGIIPAKKIHGPCGEGKGRLKKAELKRQIEALQAQVGELPDSDPESPGRAGPSSPKRRKIEGVLLAPNTPSPKKKQRDEGRNRSSNAASNNSSRHALKNFNSMASATAKGPAEEFIPVKPAASNVLSKLATVTRHVLEAEEKEPLVRSSAFTDRPQPPEVVSDAAPRRDDRLALIEDLEVGPANHQPSFNDPYFKQLEPNSGIRLSSRIVPHEDLQDHLRGRYYLSPSRLYSVVRLLPDKQGFDVPVCGDWITIAVVAERGPYKYSKAPMGITRDEEDDKTKEQPKPSGKRYINMKLVDFGSRARSASSATGGKAVIRGDALLSLLLFEDEGPPKKVYRGGSRGAFEEMSSLKEGDPFQRANDTPHPTSNILAVTPESATSVMVIGRAQDLGLCGAIKRDGKVCGSCDICEWHVQNAVERGRASRPEFSVGDEGPAYDPARQWGLKPVGGDAGGDTTYVVSGHIIRSGADPRDSMHIAENMGREGQAKARRKMLSRDTDRALKALFDRDRDGMQAVVKAREAGHAQKAEKREGSSKGKGKGKAKEGEVSTSKTAQKVGAEPKALSTKNAYSAEIIKQLGFDPTVKAGHRRYEDDVMKKKLADLASVQSSRKNIALGPRPGDKIRSDVSAPLARAAKPKPAVDSSRLHDLDSDDDALMQQPVLLPPPKPEEGPEVRMVDLDDF
ncbi:hypothetical protein C8J57DRAFT_1449997 [Mycena rebaudengoi]|nr:hypothetical protein C8J57DRAFT_1449997 [Mycena rebaudengoi]